MSTQPPMQEGWTPEELQQFGVEAEAPPIPAATNPNADELLKLQLQSQQEQQRQTALLQQEILRQRTASSPSANGISVTPPEKGPDKLKVMQDPDGNLYVEAKDIENVAQRNIDNYHQNVIAPAAPILEKVEQSQNLQNTIAWLQSEDPKLLEGKDPTQVAGLAVGLYNSALNPGRDDIAKSAYVLQNLRNMSFESGNPAIRQAQPANQVGRTLSGAPQAHPYPPNSKITINRTTPQEMGLDKFETSIQQEAYLREYNDQNKMGWTFNIQRPR